jgi:hypothetical protein
LNGLMMASIFFTERLPGTSILQTAVLLHLTRGVQVVDRSGPARKADLLARRAGTLIQSAVSYEVQSRFPKSRVCAKL